MSRMRLLVLSVVAALAGVVFVAAPAQAADVTISGVVRDANGAPLPGQLDLAVMSPDDVVLHSTSAAADGSYQLAAPAGLTIRIEFANVIGSSQPRGGWTEDFATTADRVENLTVALGATIHAQVTVGEGGPPAANADVRALSPRATTTTSGGLDLITEGGSGCTTLVLGTCDLAVLRGGTVSGFEIRTGNQPLQTFPGMSTPNLENTRTFALATDFPVSGVLTDADGSGVAGATVDAISGSTTVSTTTAADGSYVVRAATGTVWLRVRGTTGAPWSERYEFVTGSFTLDRPRTVSLSLPRIVTLQIIVKDSFGEPVPGTQMTMTDDGSVVTGATADGVPVTTYLSRGGVAPPSCSANTQGICEFPVFQGGTTGAFTVTPPYGYTRAFSHAAAVPGDPRQVLVQLTGYASTPSAGTEDGRLLAITSSSDLVGLSAQPVTLPAGVEALVGRVNYRIRMTSSGGGSGMTLRLPPGAKPNALLRLGADGEITDISATAYLGSDGINFGAVDGAAFDEDGHVDGFASGNVIPVLADPIVLDTVDPLAAAKGKAYSTRLSGSGPWPVVGWELSGSGLPPGLTLSPDGQISGTATALGTYWFSVRIRDSLGRTAVRSLSLTVATIAVATTTVPDAYLGGAYSFALKYAGGSLPSWALTGGALPPGLKLSYGGTISGTPTAAGTYRFAVVVSSAGKSSPPQWLTMVVRPMEIATTALPEVVVGTSYSQKLTTLGGKSTLVWSVASGSLPPGLTLSPLGTLSGTPTSVGSWPVTMRVTDGSTPAQTAERSFVLVVGPMQVATTTLKNATRAWPYSATLTATGGVGTRTWSLTGGSLPSGISLSPGGKLSGTPSTRGTWTFTVRVTDSGTPKNEATGTLTLTVA